MEDDRIKVVFPDQDDGSVTVTFRLDDVETSVLFATGLRGRDPGVPTNRRLTAIRMAVMAAEAFTKAALAETGDRAEPPEDAS